MLLKLCLEWLISAGGSGGSALRQRGHLPARFPLHLALICRKRLKLLNPDSRPMTHTRQPDKPPRWGRSSSSGDSLLPRVAATGSLEWWEDSTHHGVPEPDSLRPQHVCPLNLLRLGL